MRTHRTLPLAVAFAAALLAGCSSPAEDAQVTGAEDATGSEATDAPAGDGGGGAADADADAEVDGEVDGDGDEVAGASVPAMLDGPDGIDHWDETQVDLGEGTLTIDAKVADTPERRRQGLMRVPEVPDSAGMLFLFDDLRSGGFWMKDTLAPLDIAYIAGDEIVSILQMDPCEADPCPSFDPGVPYDAALEVAQGRFAEAGIAEGDAVTWTDPVEVG